MGCARLCAMRGVDVTIVAPRFAHARDDDACDRAFAVAAVADVDGLSSVRCRSCRARARERIARAQIVHAHSPFVTGWLGADIARRRGIPLVFTYHTRIDEYAHYAPFEPRIARDAMIALTRDVRESRRRR